MRESRLSYMESFHCVGGSCPDTCCRDWEVVLDEETAARYRAEAGPLGKTLRAAMEEEAQKQLDAQRREADDTIRRMEENYQRRHVQYVENLFQSMTKG